MHSYAFSFPHTILPGAGHHLFDDGLFCSGAEASFIVQAPNSLGLSRGLVGYWSFDGKHMAGSRAYDQSGQGNSGILMNGFAEATGPQRTIGKLGQALKFDGTNDLVQVADNNSLDITGELTLAAWVYPQELNCSSFNYCMILLKGDFDYGDGNCSESQGPCSSDAIPSNYFLALAGNEVNFGFYTTQFRESQTSGANIPINKWSHLVAVYNDAANRVTIYVNGLAFQSFAQNNSLTTNSIQLGIGTGGDGEQFNGLIDDVRIYNRALSADEIKRLYKIGGTARINTSIPGPTNGLVGFWSFDGKAMAGNRAFDMSGQGNYGTLTGSNGLPVRTIGKIGQGMQFDGVDDYVTVADNNVLDTGSVTVGFWMYIHSPVNCDTGNNWRALMRKGINAQTTTGWDIVLEQFNTFNWDLGDGSATNRLTTNTGTWTLDQWDYFTFTYDEATGAQKVFKNGVSIASAIQTPFSIAANTNPVDMARGTNAVSCPSQNGYAPVRLDDVRIYNRALSADEIKRLYKIGGTAKINITLDGPQSGLVGWWTFDGTDVSGTHVYDQSGQGNRGVMTNGPALAKGKLGQALQFDGVDDYVNMTDVLDPLTGDYSISAWIKPGIVTGAIRAFIGKEAVGGTDRFYVAVNSSATLQALWMVDSTNNFEANFGGSALKAGTWYHVVVTFDRDNVATGYVDGVQEPTTRSISTTNGLTFDNGNQLILGNRFIASGQRFTGLLDDVRVYNRVLSPDEIKRLYNMGR